MHVTIAPKMGFTDTMGNPHDMKSAEGMYSGFISTLKWAVPLLAIITLIVVMMIS